MPVAAEDFFSLEKPSLKPATNDPTTFLTGLARATPAAKHATPKITLFNIVLPPSSFYLNVLGTFNDYPFIGEYTTSVW
jgi:ABC-type molybdate transport system permease subunit